MPRDPNDKPDVDVVVIGGGVNGTGVARDAALRGLRVALFERNDLAFGASGNSSGMIHGGPRYLTYDPSVTESSCLDSGYIQSIAPHLLFRIPFLFPVGAGPVSHVALSLIDAFFEAYDRYQPLKRGKPHTRLSADDLRALEPGLRGDVIGGVSFDEWGIDGARLVAANAVDARRHGARVSNHTTVLRVLRREDTGAPYGVEVRDRLTGRAETVTARVIVNATGAWSQITTGLAGLPDKSAPVRGGKGIHIVYDRRLTNYAIVARTIDGRQIFLEPWQNMSVLGTTDDDYYGDLDDVCATEDEVRDLEQALAKVFPAIKGARAIGTYAGVRPSLFAWGKIEDKLSREHEVIDHAAHGAPGLVSMIGGKLASYRLFAEEATDEVARLVGRGDACATHRRPLPGGERVIDPFALADRIGCDAVAARRLVYRHGSDAELVAERVRRRPAERAVVCACEPVLEAEVRHVVEHELARTVADVARRTRLGLGACGGYGCALRCGQLVAGGQGLSPRAGRLSALQFLEAQAARRAPALGAVQARQEALGLASLRAEVGLGRSEEDEP
ncbi:MAG: glycerol-3-phosphate dehydrogenase/oxidase [Polyangiaceae bacterium]|nr:glycerol-3-phosphate dehydrogenase/oxidase [Polyangiaceae bacterium]